MRIELLRATTLPGIESTEIGGEPRVWRVPNREHLVSVAFPPTSYAQPVTAVKNGVCRV